MALNDQNYYYTNSIETFDDFYAEGFRLFEYDFVITSDNHLVGCHNYEYLSGYSSQNRISYEEYIRSGIVVTGQTLAGVTISNLAEKMKQYSDCFFVVDTKETDYLRFYNILVDEFKNCLNDNEYQGVISRVIPQIYDKSMWEMLRNNFDFETYIFTNYKANYSADEILEYFSDERICYITLPNWSNIDASKLKAAGKQILYHTINNKNEALTFIKQKHADGFYSDVVLNK